MPAFPYRCATTVSQAYSCMNPGVDKTPQAWGDLVRAAYPGYAGTRPRVSIWQGQSATTVAPMNGVELRDQFTNVLGVSQTPSTSGSLDARTTWQEFGASAVRLTKITSSTTTPPSTSTRTSPTSTTTASCITASNYAHVQAGRAHVSGGYALAVGSNQNLGLYNTFYTATLKQSSPGYWVKC